MIDKHNRKLRYFKISTVFPIILLPFVSIIIFIIQLMQASLPCLLSPFSKSDIVLTKSVLVLVPQVNLFTASLW